MAYVTKNLPIMIEYVNQWLLHLDEIKTYSEDWNDIDYYNKWYAKVGTDLSDDPTGVVSFVLWKYFDCDKEEKSKKRSANCRTAERLGICITNDKFELDPLNCMNNLEKKQRKFSQYTQTNR